MDDKKAAIEAKQKEIAAKQKEIQKKKKKPRRRKRTSTKIIKVPPLPNERAAAPQPPSEPIQKRSSIQEFDRNKEFIPTEAQQGYESDENVLFTGNTRGLAGETMIGGIYVYFIHMRHA